ncbi:double-strand-break repair protein rad21 homolog [Uloborus diversus]|uniref:double-strand-break repair protein rad21 homolog n=1 Tax=Uloborus diversus TaxID=327109 RepID=UPI002409F740|nr:double-strand-break repair protein rad21 homolog [Uloborus diversus]
METLSPYEFFTQLEPTTTEELEASFVLHRRREFDITKPEGPISEDFEDYTPHVFRDQNSVNEWLSLSPNDVSLQETPCTSLSLDSCLEDGFGGAVRQTLLDKIDFLNLDNSLEDSLNPESIVAEPDIFLSSETSSHGNDDDSSRSDIILPRLSPSEKSSSRLSAPRRKRRKVDKTTFLALKQIKQNITSTDDIVTDLKLGPKTKQLQKLKSITVKKLFDQPGQHILSKTLRKFYNTKRFKKTTDKIQQKKKETLDNHKTLDEPTESSSVHAVVVNDYFDGSASCLFDSLGDTYCDEDDSRQLIGNDTSSRENIIANNTDENNLFEISRDDVPSEQEAMVSTVSDLGRIFNQFDNEEISFRKLTKGKNRMGVAKLFSALLVMKKEQTIELQQSSSLSDVVITKGPQFNVTEL